MKKRSDRRDFLQQAALAGVGFWALGGVRAAESTSPNEKINVASIGVGGKGSSDCEQAGQVGNMVAICDIDDRTLNEMAHKFPKARKYHDFRNMLEELDKQIDAVTVSTPDHTHAVAALMAMKMGKHVYCQKPLTHTVQEARLMRETAEKCKVQTQMGNQGTAEDGLRRAVELVQAGVIGPVREAHVWTNRPIWPQAPKVTKRPDHADAIPPEVHWNLWLGPAPKRPFVNGVYHSFNWRGWWDFGTGALGDMACHTANMAFMALKLGYPTSIEAESGPINSETYPAWARITFQFPARDEMPPVKFVWYEGKKDDHRVLPPEELTRGQKISDSGSLLVGDKGTLFSPNDYGADYKLLPEEEFRDLKEVPKKLPRNGRGDPGMKEEWVGAIKGGPKPMSNFGYAGLLTETILLGNVAMRFGKKLEWDGPNMRVTNYPEAEQYLKVEPRKGWYY